MMNKHIVVIGSSNTDMIVKLARIPKPGETVLGGEFYTAPGGKGANQAVSAARAGGKVFFIARIGEDMFGNRALKGFEVDGLDTRYIIQDKDFPSGVALIFVDEEGENSIAVASGCNAHLSPSDIKTAEDVISTAMIVLMQLETPIETVTAATEIAAGYGVPVILNPAPAQPLGDDLLKHIAILTPNESEAELLTGIKVADDQGTQDAAESLLAKGIRAVLITLGSRGVYIASDEFKGIIPAFTVTAEDTTAAGDVFNGALAVSLAERNTLRDAVRFANAAAALSVTKIGAQPSAPSRPEIELFLEGEKSEF